MKIQKIFSEVNTDEKLYSVLMSEEELSLFSEIQKEFNSKASKERNNRWRYFETHSGSNISKSYNDAGFLRNIVQTGEHPTEKIKIAEDYLQRDEKLKKEIMPRLNKAYLNVIDRGSGTKKKLEQSADKAMQKVLDRTEIQRMGVEREGANKIRRLDNRMAQIRENKKLTNKIRRGFKRIISKIK